jgi:hypothetical protein
MIAGRALAEHGVSCAPLDVRPALDLGSLSIGPTECTAPEGPVSSLGLELGATVSLASLQPTAIDVPRIAMVPRAAPAEGEAAEVGPALLSGLVPEPLQRALSGLAHLSARMDLPRVHVAEVDLGRGLVLEGREARVDREGDALVIRLASFGPPAHHGDVVDLRASVDEIEIHATPSEVTATGALVFDADVGRLLEIDRSIALRLHGAALDGAEPSFTLWIEPSPMLERARARLAELQRRIAETGSAREAIQQALAERRDARRERTHDLAERLEQRVEELHAREAPAAPTP